MEHLIISENKKVLKTHTQTLTHTYVHRHAHTHTLLGYVKGTQDSTERALNGKRWKNLCNKINKVVLD